MTHIRLNGKLYDRINFKYVPKYARIKHLVIDKKGNTVLLYKEQVVSHIGYQEKEYERWLKKRRLK